MKNRQNWKPTKFILNRNGLVSNKDERYVSVGSRIMVNCVAKYYYDAIKSHATGYLLDVGCGHVPLYEVYNKYVNDIYCIDWGSTMHKNEFLDIECDLNSVIPLAEHQFDTVLCTDVLEHIYHPALLLNEIFRLSKKGCKVIIGVPFLYWLHETPHDYHRYTEYCMVKMIKEAGFSIVELKVYGGSPYVIADIVAKHLSKNATICKVYNFLISIFLKTKLIQKLSDKTSAKFPLGYCIVAEKL